MQIADPESWKKRQLWSIAQTAFLINGQEPPTYLSDKQMMGAIRRAGGEVERAYEELKSACKLERFPFIEALPVDGVRWVGRNTADPAILIAWLRGFGFAVTSSLDAPFERRRTPPDIKPRVDERPSSRSAKRKPWTQRELRDLRDEARGTTQQILAAKHGVTRQRISVLLKKADDLFALRAPTLAETGTVRRIRAKKY